MKSYCKNVLNFLAHQGDNPFLALQGEDDENEEEEDTEESDAGGAEDEGERPPVVPGGPLPGLVVRQLVQGEHGPEECEAGHEDDVGQRIQEGDVGVGVVSHNYFTGNVVHYLKY